MNGDLGSIKSKLGYGKRRQGNSDIQMRSCPADVIFVPFVRGRTTLLRDLVHTSSALWAISKKLTCFKKFDGLSPRPRDHAHS